MLAMWSASLLVGFLTVAFLAPSEAYVKYQPCKEYIYNFRAKTTLHGSTTILLKGKAGFQFLPNRNTTEALLRLHNARMQQGGDEVNLLSAYNFGNWFSIQMGKHGDIHSVVYPIRESYDVISVKKTVAGYLSGKLKTLDESDRYKAEEEGPEGPHVADYERQTDSFDAVYVKKKRMQGHVAAEHAELKSSKTTYVSHEMRVPHRIVMEENINGFSKPKPGYKMSRLPLGPRGNLSVDNTMKNKEDNIPGIKIDAKAEMELVEAIDRDCKVIEPSGLQNDSLTVSLENEYQNKFWKSDYSKETEEVHRNLNTNLTCIRRNLNRAIPEKSDCFQNILSILEMIPDEYLSDIVYIYLELNEKHPSAFKRQNRLIMIDAIISLKTELSQSLILAYVTNPNRTISLDDHQRVLMQLGSFAEPPIQAAVDYIKDIAFSKVEEEKEKQLQRIAILTYGIMIKLYHYKGNQEQKKKSLKMTEILERRVGIHDPYHWRSKRSVSEPGAYHGEVDQVTLVESLGNAGLPRSYEHILSHVNASGTPYSLKRAGIHALRNFHTQEAAEVLLDRALFDEESHIRSNALDVYQRHPLSANFYDIHRQLAEGYANGTFPRCPKPMDDDEYSSMPHHHRIMKRSVWKGFQFHLKTPSTDWAKRFGNNKLGASLGLKIQNELDIDIKLTSGHVRVNVDDHAYAIAHIGMLGKNFEFLNARVCLIGGADYELNLLQEFGFRDVQEFVKYWDRFQNGVVRNIKEAVEKFRIFMSGVKDFAKNIENLDETIESIPRKVKNLRNVAIKAARKIGAIDKNALPPFAKPLVRVYWRVIKLHNDIKSDVMNFYNTLADIVRIEIPTSWRQIRQGVYVIGKSISKLFKSPKEAISGMFKAIFKIKIGIEGLSESKKTIEQHCNMLKDDRPYWWDLSKQLTEIRDELQAALKIFQRGYVDWVNQGVDNFENEMRAEAAKLLMEIHDELTAPFQDLDKLASPFLLGLLDFANVLEEVKQAWNQLKTAYREGRSIIDRLFGPKAYINFPKKLRSSGAGCGEGAYPTTNGGRYFDTGVDLEAAAGAKVKSPYAGYLSVLDDGRLIIEPDGSTFEDVIVYITNIQPENKIPRKPGRMKIYSGDVLGTVKTTECVNHLHVSMQQHGQTIDPTRYLGERKMKMPKWTQTCSEYKIVWLGNTRANGDILGSRETVDTSPKRSTSEPSNVDLPDPKTTDATRRRRRRKRDVSDVMDKVTANFNKFKNSMMKFFDVPSDLGFTQFFRDFSIRRIRLGTMVGLLNRLEMTDSKAGLIRLIHTFIDMTKAGKCIRPEQMTDEELRISLIQRGVSIEGSRDEMINEYYEKTSQCPVWGLSLPKKSSCVFDRGCLGVECCFDYRIGIFYKALKAYVSMDPCSQILEMGVTFYPRTWKKSIQVRPIPYGQEEESYTGLKVDVFGKLYTMKIKYIFTNDKSVALLNLQATLCQSTTVCLPYINVVTDMLLPVPTCTADEKVIWPEVNIKDFLNREHLIKELKKIKTNIAESAKDRALEYAEKQLKLPSGFLRKDHSVFCSRPSRMTRAQLLSALGAAASTATTTQLRKQLMTASTKCSAVTLPTLPSSLYCSISRDCFKLDCCLDISLPFLNKSVALTALIHFDPCKFTLTYGFEHSKRTKLLIDYKWGMERSWNLGSMAIKYVIDKTSDSKFFILKYGISVCPDEKCLIDKWILENHRIPVPICNENFTKCFGSDFSFKSLMERGVTAATKDAMNLVLRCLDVEKYLLADHGCPTAEACTTALTPHLERTCYPGLPCWRMQCNLKLNLFVMKKDICTWVAFNPCSYDLELGLGSWKYKMNLMKYKMGIMNEVRVGSGLRMYYKYEEGSTRKTLKMQFGVAVCYKDECTPTEYVMDGIEISKPFCDTNFTRNIPGGSIPKFLSWLGADTATTVARLAVDRALSYLGIRQCLKGQTCVLPTGVSLDGWRRACPAISGLPALSKNLRCAFSSNCRKVSCCLDIDIKIWRGSLSFFYDFDPCNMRLRAGFENCTAEENSVVVGRPVSFIFHQNVTFWYLVKKHPEGKGLLLSFRVHVCDEQCGWLNVLEDTLFEIKCEDSPKSRQKRSAMMIENKMKELLETVQTESFTLHRKRRSLVDKIQKKAEEKIPKLLKKFDDLVTEGKEKATQKYLEIQTKLQAAYKEQYGDDPQERSLVIPTNSEDNVRSSAALIKAPSPSWNFEVIPPSGGAELFQIQRGESGDLKFVVGDGLTQAGIALLGDAIANMTIGDLESMLDFKNVDPVVAYNMISQMRDLYFHLVSELVDVIFDGKMNDALFKSFDYKMNGQFIFPRVHYNYFKYTYRFIVFPVPCLFSLGFGADGYWGVNFYMRFDILSMLAAGKVDPYIGLMAWGKGAANCVIFRGSLQLNGYIMETHVPSTAEVGFYKFPLDIGLNVDIEIIPLRLELVVKVEMKVLFFMRRKRRWGVRIRFRRVFRAIGRAFRFVTRLFKKVFKWKTLFRKILWEWSMKPWRIPGVLRKKRDRRDDSPPLFKTYGRQKRSVVTQEGCKVTQVANRPIEEPAIVLESDPIDDVSKVEMFYSIGTMKGGVNLVNSMRFQGPLSIIEGKFSSRGPLHITITARNSQGLSSRAFCMLPVFDTTHATGQITSSYYMTSDPTAITMESLIFDDSDITEAFLGIGYGPGMTGDAVKRWHRIRLHRLSAPPDARGHPHKYYVTFTNLNMIHGQLHFVNILVRNNLNYSTVISSRPVLVDMTPPTSNGIINPTSDRIIKDNCLDYTLKKWNGFCPPADSKRYQNHRVVVDSPSCQVLWNGHKANEPELRWTMNSHFIAARFTPLQDNETAIRGYSMCVGTSVGSCDTFPAFDPHEAITNPAEWNYIGYAVKEHNVAFEDGRYYLTLTAINRVAQGGPFATTVSRHVPFVIDTSPPEIEFVGRMRYDVKTKRFQFLIRTKDIHSGLSKVSLGAGKTRHDISIAPMKEIHHFPNMPDPIDTFDGQLQTNLRIKDGQKIYIHLLVYNNVNMEEEYTSTRPFVVDTTPPIPGHVFMGKQTGVNYKYFGLKDELCVSWRGFNDPESGIDSYNIAFGTCKGCHDLFTIENVKPTLDKACLPRSYANKIHHGRNYFSVVTAINGGSEGLRVSVNSSSMMFDETPPISRKVVDGILVDLKQKQFSSDRSFYRFQWQQSTDPESSISAYKVSIFKRSKSSSETQNLVSDIHLKNTDRDYTATGLELRHQDRLHAKLTTINGARLETVKETAGMTFDFTPPLISVLNDGASETETQKFQSVVNQLSVTYKSNDPESNIEMWKFSVYKFINGQRHLTGVERTVRKEDAMDTSSALRYTMTPLTLSPGHRYGLEMTAINGAGLHTVQDSPGVIVDITPPHIESLTIGTLLNQNGEIHNGYIWHQNQDALTLSVLAFDPESKVKSVWISVGTSPGASDVAPSKAFKFASDQFISLTDLHLGESNLEAKPKPKPAYYVTVKAENFAGLKSAPITSLPIVVVPNDSPGVVFAGPTPAQVEEQVDNGRIVVTFKDFLSPLHGIERFEFAIGSEPGLDDIQSFTEDGFVNMDEEMTSGNIYIPQELEVGRKHYITVRAFTNAGKVMESVSAALTISQSKPVLNIDLLTQQRLHNGVLYSTEGDSVMVEVSASPNTIWMEETKSLVPHMTESIKTDVQQGPGVPVYTNIRVENKLGFQSENSSAVVVTDISVPEVNSFICDKVIQIPGRSLTCKIIGLKDPESPIVETRISVLDSSFVIGRPVASVLRRGPVSSHTFFLAVIDMTRLSEKFIVRLDVKNAAGLSTSKLSPEISRDLKPPTAGKVVDLGDVIRLQHIYKDTLLSVSSDTEMFQPLIDQRCQVSRTTMSVLWKPFNSPQSSISKCQIAAGSYQGATDMKNWTEVGNLMNNITIHNVNVWKNNKTFAAVRCTTQSGAKAIGYTNGISLSHLAIGAQSSEMGIFDGPGKNSRFQSDPMVIQSHWDFSKEPCPITRYEWAINRADGLVIRNFTDMEGLTSGVHFGLNAKDGDTFFSYIRITNALGMSYVYRSPGMTIKMEPLLPGLVFDGLLIDHDLTVQQSVDTLSANWKDFRVPQTDISSSGNIDPNWKPKIEYYEVAFGTDPHRFLDNVVPFTKVGLNVSASFDKLTLNPGTVYHATVRAYSRWFSQTQATSSGMRVGVDTTITGTSITNVPFTNSSDIVTISWKAFHTNIGMKLYFVGMRETKAEDKLTCSDIALANEDSSLLRDYYDTYPRTMVENSLKFDFKELPFKHNTNYTIDVVGINMGGKCARTKSNFLVDFTPPVSGIVGLKDIRTYQNVYFVREKSYLNIKWSGFFDKESSISSFTISLLQSTTTCNSKQHQQTLLKNGKPAVFIVSSSTNEFVIQDIELQVGVAYYIKVEATNRAGGADYSLSKTIILENLSAAKGSVKTTDDFREMTAFYFTDDDLNMNISFLHTYASGHLELEPIPSSSGWTKIKDSGLTNVKGYPWILLHTDDMVKFKDDVITLTMRRLIGQRGVEAGGISRPTSFRAGGSFSFRMQAARGPHAVSSFVVWDGAAVEAADFHTSQHAELKTVCACCINEQNEACSCDCTQYLQSLLETDTTPEQQDDEPQSDSWRVIPDQKETVQTGISQKEMRQHNACGVQISPSSATTQNVTLWCFNKATGISNYETVKLLFDATSAEHDYKIDYIHTVIGTWSIRLLIDDNEMINIEGELPVFPDKVTALFHLWNNWRSLAPLGSLENPYQTSLTVRNIKFPNPSTDLLRYGHPFRLSDSYPVLYDVRIALIDSNTTQVISYITDWKTIASPCVPCISPCSALYCDPNCTRESLDSMISTIYDVGFMQWVGVNGANITRFQAHLRLRSYGGYMVESVSTPATLDFTPPQQLEGAPISYFDVKNQEPFKAIQYQASNTTLSVTASFVDPESGIAEVYWAAGTEPGATDISDYSLINVTGIGERGGLSLKDNTSYYVSFTVINYAGMMAVYTDTTGVKVLCTAPDVSEMQVNVSGTTNFGPEVRANNTKVTQNSDQISAAWNLPSQEYETKTEFCVGSHPGVADDVVDCMKVDHRKSGHGDIKFQNGELQVANQADVNVSEVLNLKSDKQSVSKGIHLEPGKTLHYHVRGCNAADLCTEKPLDKVQVMNSESNIITPKGNTYSSTPLDLRTRRKRDTTSIGSFLVYIKTAPGENDVSLIVGKIDDSEKYRADTVINYNSYIVNIDATKHKLSRMLQNRITEFLRPSFYITTVGQAEMKHPFDLVIDVQDTKTKKGFSPQVVYWNTETQLWSLAYFTCLEESQSKLESGKIAVKICRTQTGAANFTTPSNAVQHFFRYETQFAVAIVNDTIPNQPPVIAAVPALYINGTEEAYVARIQLQATDPENDGIMWSIISPLPTLGNVHVDGKTGKLTYQPYVGAIGKDVLRIQATDQPPYRDIPPKSSVLEITAHLTTKVNSPYLVVSVDGVPARIRNYDVSNQVEFSVIGWTEKSKSCFVPSVVDIYVLHYDVHKTMSLYMPGSSKLSVDFHLSNVSNVQPVFNSSHSGISNSLSIYNWYHARLYYGALSDSSDSLQRLELVAQDPNGQPSKPLMMEISMMEKPCTGITDHLAIIIAVSVVSFLLISALVIFAVIRYHRTGKILPIFDKNFLSPEEQRDRLIMSFDRSKNVMFQSSSTIPTAWGDEVSMSSVSTPRELHSMDNPGFIVERDLSVEEATC